MTNTTWKHAIFLGGAVLILAACADVTAPTPNLQQTTRRAAAKSSSPTTTETTLNPTSLDCKTGYSVQVGFSLVCDF
jgi:hypothetical protein